MRFTRRRSSLGLPALLAVAMQAAAFLALAHVHPHTHTHAPGMSRAWTAGAVAVECRGVVTRPGCAPVVPHDSREECPLCWSLAAAGTALLPADRGMPVPSANETRYVAPFAASFATHTFAHFDARAPPAA